MEGCKMSFVNIRFIQTRERRLCSHCGNIIQKGKECLTYNPKNGHRIWFCNNCVCYLLRVDLARKLNFPYGEECASRKQLAYVDDVEEDLIDRGLTGDGLLSKGMEAKHLQNEVENGGGFLSRLGIFF
jgi:hypothetical protein